MMIYEYNGDRAYKIIWNHEEKQLTFLYPNDHGQVVLDTYRLDPDQTLTVPLT